MKKFFKLAAWLLCNLATMPIVFYTSIHYFTGMVLEEYRTGARSSGDGDSVMIPAMGCTMMWILLLAAVNFIILTVWMTRRYRRQHGNQPNPASLRDAN